MLTSIIILTIISSIIIIILLILNDKKDEIYPVVFFSFTIIFALIFFNTTEIIQTKLNIEVVESDYGTIIFNDEIFEIYENINDIKYIDSTTNFYKVEKINVFGFTISSEITYKN